MVNNVELKEIFLKLRNDDKEAFDVFCNKYSKLIYKIAFSICKNDVNSEDIVQNVLLKIYKLDKDKLPNMYEMSWLYRVVKNEAIDYLKKFDEHINIDELYDIDGKYQDIEKIIDIDTFKNMIKHLKKEEKEILSLKILSGFSFEEIGNMLKEPVGTIKWRYYKSIKSLRLCLTNSMLALIAFILGNYENVRNYTSMDRDYSVVEKGDNSIDFNNLDINMFDAVEDKSYIGKEIDINFSHICLGISGVFLIISIIFGIFYKKYQLKLKNKSSK